MSSETKLSKSQEKKIEKIKEKLIANPELIPWVEITIAKIEESARIKNLNKNKIV